ncbi:MAG: hypothetical protein KKA79_09525 [Nanoarchaeota archaeon]|nr:hypothetical protein [Nanoarchaeota archaeon]
MDKKGISPLVSAVLIISFVIVLAILIFQGTSSFTENLQEKSETTAFGSMRCTSDVLLTVKKPCRFGNEIKYLVENGGSKDFEGLFIKVYGPEGTDTITYESPIKAGELVRLTAVFDIEKTGNVKGFEVFPLLELRGKTLYCPNNYEKEEDIISCQDPCENAHPDLCNGLDIVFGEGFKDMCCVDFKLCC